MKKGFTLIELLLYSGLASIVIATVAAFYASLLSARVNQETISEVEQQGQAVLSQITQAIRNAESVTTPTAAASGSSLVLDVYDSASDPTTYDLSSGAIRICEGSGCTATALTGSNVTVSSLTFRNVTNTGSPGSVRVEFTMNSAGNTTRQEYDYQKNFYATASLR